MKRFVLTSLATLILTAAVSPVIAQKTGATGLDALDEQRVMGELVDRGMETLLNREFDVNQTPQQVRDGVLSRIAMRRLSDPNSHLTLKEREDLLQQVAKGIVQALPNMKDPTQLMQSAKVLVTVGVAPDINSLEYWGENKRKQTHAKPLVDTVIKIYQKAEAEAQRLEDIIANQMTPNSSPKAWEDMDSLHNLAIYSENMSKYDQCLTLDKDDPLRKKIADDAITNLTQYDNDQSGVQAVVRNRIAKLNMAKGDYDAAKKAFAAVINNPNGDIKPAPVKSQQYEAKYFSIVCDILAGKLDDAQKEMVDLDTWQKANLDPRDLKGASAAFVMLKYRIISTQADQETDAAKKADLNNQAIAVLMGLLRDDPEYKTTIFEQVMTRLPDNPDVATLDPLLLLALQQQGLDEFFKPADQAIDQKVLDRAIAATQEIIKRKGQPGVDVQTEGSSAYMLGYLLQKENKNKEAAGAFLDYAQNYQTDLTKASDALLHAQALIGQMRQADITDQDAKNLYDRFLPIAIAPPFNQKKFAFEYASLLQHTQRYKQAVEYFKMVDPNDKRILSARYFEMIALKQRLNDDNDKMDSSERDQVMSDIQQLADQVNKGATAAQASATTNDEKKRFESMLVRTALLAADLAGHEQKQPQRALDLLDGFEGRITDQEPAVQQEMLVEVLTLRVNAYMALGKTDDATKCLVQLIALGKNGGNDAGPALVFDLLQKLNTEMDKARAANDTQQVKSIAQNRAALTGFLVTWAEGNSDPKIKAAAPKYRAIDASTKQLAAELNDDPVGRKKQLEDALKQYLALDDPNNPDPRVKLGIGEVQFDLGNYKAAAETLSPLILNKQLGGPTATANNNGIDEIVDNPVYWEANYQLLRSIAEVAKQNPNDPSAQSDLAAAKQDLKNKYLLFPQGIGGKKYHADFEKLRAEIIPDFNPDAVASPTTVPAAPPVATQ
jgi:hypothetical protein